MVMLLAAAGMPADKSAVIAAVWAVSCMTGINGLRWRLRLYVVED